MENINKEARGFVVIAPQHLQTEQLRCLFSGVDQKTGKEVYITFTPLLVPGHVTPAEFAEDISHAVALEGALRGTMTLFWPEFDLGRFTYHPAGSNKPTETGAMNPREITKEMVSERGPAKAQNTSHDRTPPPASPSRDMGMEMDF